jgi:RHS repeat-associated protein
MKTFIILLLPILSLLASGTAFARETSYTYTNQEQDKSGLMHYDSRYYDPDLGRFLQPDSFDVPNKYAYVSNDPVNKVDPSGHLDFNITGNYLLPEWQTLEYDDGFYYSQPAYSETNYQYIGDGITVDMNSQFSLDNFSHDLLGEYSNTLLGKVGISPSVGLPIRALLDTLIEFYGLDSEAGPLAMVGGISWAKDVITAGKLDILMTNKILMEMKLPYKGNLEMLACSQMCLGDAARVLQANKGIGAIGQVSDDIGMHFFPIIEKNAIPWVVDTSLYGKVMVNFSYEKNLLLKDGYLNMPLDKYFDVLDSHIPDFSKSFRVNSLPQL